MNWYYKKFESLNLKELYSILKLRSKVFVVEQNCVYQDLDDWDDKATHLMGMKDNNLIAYARLFEKNIKYPGASSIGRVVVEPDYRSQSLGKTLMMKAIQELKIKDAKAPINISAQCYLENFYQNLGFKIEGKPYLEDDILHQKMIYL